jgi:serine/threonine-protein kinase
MEVFGRYQVIQPIAKGGMAEIVLARPMSGARRHCALKRILPAFSCDEHFVSMFIDEARITIGLSHPNVVRLDDFGQVDGVYFMAIEYVDGSDLGALLRTQVRSGTALPPMVAAAIVRDVAAGLAHAHGLTNADGVPLGVVHRDVSPQNILLSSTGQVKLTDFGIAAAKNKLSLTTPGMVLGKAPYMAPEQARGEAIDFRTDLWALGVVLWECLVGDRLFANGSAIDTIERVLNSPIPRPSSRRPGIPASLDALTLSLLSRDINDRPRRSQDVTRALDAIITQLAASSSWAIDGHFDDSCLARFLASVQWSDDTAPMRPRAPSPPAVSPGATTQKRATPLIDDVDDPELRALVARLRDEREPWLLVDIGHRAQQLRSLDELALSAWRTAAAGFASRGLLVQALAAHAPVRELVGDTVADDDIMALGELTPGHDGELIALLTHVDRHGLGGHVTGVMLPPPPKVPLLGDLGPRELARLAKVVTVTSVKAGTIMIREGERGDALYAVARGRMVVSCNDLGSHLVGSEPDWTTDVTAREGTHRIDDKGNHQQRQISLAGLADGDFFGEFSFLAERPRSATVEAVSDGIVIKIERSDVEHIASVDPAFTAPLLEFYKERVVELLMAKSPIFSLLPPNDRRALLKRARSIDAADGQVIVKEGMRNDSLFFIRRGEVEVYRNDPADGVIFINKLGPGQFFGEMAALRHRARTVSVRAIGPTTVLEIESAALQAVVDSDPRLEQLFDTMMAHRTAEVRTRVQEHHRVLGT